MVQRSGVDTIKYHTRPTIPMGKLQRRRRVTRFTLICLCILVKSAYLSFLFPNQTYDVGIKKTSQSYYGEHPKLMV